MTYFLRYESLTIKDWAHERRLFCEAGLFLQIQHFFGSSETFLTSKINHYCVSGDNTDDSSRVVDLADDPGWILVINSVLSSQTMQVADEMNR